jgi:hypothetical protein
MRRGLLRLREPAATAARCCARVSSPCGASRAAIRSSSGRASARGPPSARVSASAPVAPPDVARSPSVLSSASRERCSRSRSSCAKSRGRLPRTCRCARWRTGGCSSARACSGVPALALVLLNQCEGSLSDLRAGGELRDHVLGEPSEHAALDAGRYAESNPSRRAVLQGSAASQVPCGANRAPTRAATTRIRWPGVGTLGCFTAPSRPSVEDPLQQHRSQDMAGFLTPGRRYPLGRPPSVAADRRARWPRITLTPAGTAACSHSHARL